MISRKEFKHFINPLFTLKELAEKVLKASPKKIGTELGVLIAHLHLANELVKLWDRVNQIATHDKPLSLHLKTEIAVIGTALVAVGEHLRVQNLASHMNDYKIALKKRGLFAERHGFINFDVFWQRLLAMIQAYPDRYDYDELQHPFISWYVSLRMNALFAQPHKLRSHYLRWAVPQHFELLSHETCSALIDSCIEYESEVWRLIAILYHLSMGENDQEAYKHQQRLNYALERALFHGNLDIANAVTQPAPYGLTGTDRETSAAIHITPIAKMAAKLPMDVNKVIYCLHLALESQHTRFIELVLQHYDIGDLFQISLTYPSLVLARFTFEHCPVTVTLSKEQASALTHLAARCGDVNLLNKILRRCNQDDSVWLFHNIIQQNFIPARDADSLWLTADRSKVYTKNQRTYRKMFFENAATLASHMDNNQLSFTINDNGKMNLYFLGRLRRAMAYAVHPNSQTACYGLLRHEQSITGRTNEMDEYFDECDSFLRDAKIDTESHYHTIIDVCKIEEFIKPTSVEINIAGQKTKLPLTTYISHSGSGGTRCEAWKHPDHETIPLFHSLLRELQSTLNKNDSINYLRCALSILFYSTHPGLWQRGTAACNDMILHAQLYRAKMLMPYETIGRSDCLAFTKIDVEEFIARWPVLLGLNTLDQCVDFLQNAYQLHCKNRSIEMTESGVLRETKYVIAEALVGEPIKRLPSVLIHLVQKYFPQESPPFSKALLEMCLRTVAVKGTPQECRFLLAEVDVNARNENESKNTALHFAVYHGRLQIVRALLAHPDIDTSVKNAELKTPRHYIERHKNKPELYQALLNEYPKPAENLALVVK